MLPIILLILVPIGSNVHTFLFINHIPHGTLVQACVSASAACVSFYGHAMWPCQSLMQVGASQAKRRHYADAWPRVFTPAAAVFFNCQTLLQRIWQPREGEGGGRGPGVATTSRSWPSCRTEACCWGLDQLRGIWASAGCLAWFRSCCQLSSKPACKSQNGIAKGTALEIILREQ